MRESISRWAAPGVSDYDWIMEFTLDVPLIREILDQERTRAREEFREVGVVRALERSLRRHDEALAILRRLEAEYAAADEPGGFVFEEIAENLLAQQQADAAKPYFAKAWQLLSADTSLDRPDDAHLARLERLSR